MYARVILAAATLLVTSQGWSAPLDGVGQPLPVAPSAAAAAPADLPDWQSPVLDDLPARVIRGALAQPLADQGALTTRGAKEIGLYRAAAPAVVLIVTFDDGLGSGSYLGDGRILTNAHVVGTSRMVGVLFKPDEGAPDDFDGLIRADVVKTDEKHDLALLKLSIVPKSVKPLELGSASEIQVGADVFAIGHPTGQAWSYTRGLISQVRDDFQWRGDDKVAHQANVIQTQTPISPGNSGGPLLGESGKILGVNAFKAPDGENLNFAISVKDVAVFVRPAAGADAGGADHAGADNLKKWIGTSPPETAKNCLPKALYNGRNEKNDGQIIVYDTNCDGRADAVITTPDDKTRPITAEFDTNSDGKVDIIVEDLDRDGRWDVSYYDVDFDGKIDLIGYHPDGQMKASRFEKYVENKSARR